MPLNNQTPDPRFQRVLAAARKVVQVEVNTQGSNVDWPTLAADLLRLREALWELEGATTSTAAPTRKKPLHAT